LAEKTSQEIVFMPMNLKKTLLFSLVMIPVLILSASSFAADVALKGYLIDSACSSRRASKPASLTAHGKSCMKMPSCSNSGFGVLTEDKQFIRFDEDGNQKAIKFLNETTLEHDFKVTVSGTMDGDKIKVGKIEPQ
jgi:hypothetical protein